MLKLIYHVILKIHFISKYTSALNFYVLPSNIWIMHTNGFIIGFGNGLPIIWHLANTFIKT